MADEDAARRKMVLYPVRLDRLPDGRIMLDGHEITPQQAMEYVNGFSSLEIDIPGQSYAEKLTRYIQNEIQNYEPGPGLSQWYVDENCIDCDADEFWPALQAALDKFFGPIKKETASDPSTSSGDAEAGPS